VRERKENIRMIFLLCQKVIKIFSENFVPREIEFRVNFQFYEDGKILIFVEISRQNGAENARLGVEKIFAIPKFESRVKILF